MTDDLSGDDGRPSIALDGARIYPDMPIHADGVYFGMPDSEYHSDPALGSTDIRRLLVSPSDYWWYSQYNGLRPLREEDEGTPAQIRGRAIHSFVLMGPEDFDRQYCRAPQKADHPDALVTVDDLKRVLKSHNLEISGLKADLVKRVRTRLPKYRIWESVVEEAEASGKILLPPRTYDEIIVSSAMITKNPSLAHAFKGGQPEVSVFWTSRGIRCKCRFDYLKVRAIGDLKSFTNTLDQPVHRAITRSIANHRYDIQASWYLNGRERAREAIRRGDVFGPARVGQFYLPTLLTEQEEIDLEWLQKIALQDAYTFVFVFYGVSGAPVARAMQFDPATEADHVCAREIEHALDLYEECMNRFGTDMWVDTTPVHILGPGDFPSWMGM